VQRSRRRRRRRVAASSVDATWRMKTAPLPRRAAAGIASKAASVSTPNGVEEVAEVPGGDRPEPMIAIFTVEFPSGRIMA